MLLTHGASCSSTDTNGTTIYDDLLHIIPSSASSWPQVESACRMLRTLLLYDAHAHQHPRFKEIVNHAVDRDTTSNDTSQEKALLQAIINTSHKDTSRHMYNTLSQEARVRCVQVAITHNRSDIAQYIINTGLNDDAISDILLHTHIIQTLYPHYDLNSILHQLPKMAGHMSNLFQKTRQHTEAGTIPPQTFAHICRTYKASNELCPEPNEETTPFVLLHAMYNHDTSMQQVAVQAASRRIADGIATPFEITCLFAACPQHAAAYRDESGNSLLHQCAIRPQYRSILNPIATHVMNNPNQNPRNNSNETPAMIAKRHNNMPALNYLRSIRGTNELRRPVVKGDRLPIQPIIAHSNISGINTYYYQKTSQTPLQIGLQRIRINSKYTSLLPQDICNHIRTYMA